MIFNIHWSADYYDDDDTHAMHHDTLEIKVENINIAEYVAMQKIAEEVEYSKYFDERIDYIVDKNGCKYMKVDDAWQLIE